MARIKRMIFSQESIYNGKKIIDMTNTEKDSLIKKMEERNGSGSCIIQGYNDKEDE